MYIYTCPLCPSPALSDMRPVLFVPLLFRFSIICSGFFDSVGLWEDPTQKHRDTVDRWIQWLQLHHVANKMFMSLSQGEQRLVLLARAMVKGPAVLLLDEPTHGLDAQNRARFLKVVDAIGSSGRCTVVMVSHHRDEFLHCISHELNLTQNGEVQSCGPIKQ